MTENTSKTNTQSEINTSWIRLINTITHDFKTPLITIRATTQAIESIFPELINAYKLAVEHKLIEPIKNENKLQFVQNKALPSIKSTIEELFNANKTMMTYVHELKIPIAEMPELSIKSCVDEALQSYPFQDNERSLIKIDILDDFKFKGIQSFMHDLLSNLIDNALRAIAASKRGDISIWTSANEQYNQLHFKDTGPGIDLKHSNIFDRYSSKRDGAIKAGLGFCRLELLVTQADITCDSTPGETHFILHFPK